MRLWPDTLAGRTLLLLGASILVFVLAAGGLLTHERRETFRNQQRHQLIVQTLNLYQLLREAPIAQRDALIAHYRSGRLGIDLSPLPALPPRPPEQLLERFLTRRLHRALPGIPIPDIRVRVRAPQRPPGPFRPPPRPGMANDQLLISLPLPPGLWLNLDVHDYHQPPPWTRPTLYLLLGLLLLIGLAGYWTSRRLSRPMRELARAAERFGLGQVVEPLAEQGPREVRETIRAFNQMQARLQRNLRERSLMLAAVSHDLRTPITALRLRAEYIEEPEMRERTLATLEQMESIINETLAFARDEGRDHRQRRFDLSALLQTLCDEYGDLGHRLDCQLPDRLICSGRPSALQRALTNLLDNALRYGQTVQLRLTSDADGLLIEIADDGPGIPDDQLEEVFTPFYRVDASRNEETGGIGLGLAIARMLIHAQGGSLTLGNRQPHGLLARVRLPG